MNEFSHLNESGNVQMVDVTDKSKTVRMAKSKGIISMSPETISAIKGDTLPKGNVLTTAKISGIQAAKKTADIIPMCHQLNLTFVDLQFEVETKSIIIKSTIKTKEATGVEMEALTAVSVAALTIFDMCKAIDKTMSIGEISLIKKVGGKSDHVAEYRPQVGVITISDSVSMKKSKDRSGPILINGFTDSGCTVGFKKVLPDGSDKLASTVSDWIKKGAELIITTGGTGIGPRDLTVHTIEKLFDSKLPGIEQALHSYGYKKEQTAILSRLTSGVIQNTIVISLPGSPCAVKDALNVLIPTIFHSFHMMKGEKH
jgi:molybdenum cofactor biosynthesis protein MoaC